MKNQRPSKAAIQCNAFAAGGERFHCLRLATIGVKATATLLASGLLGIATAPAMAAPSIPTNDEQVLERLPWRAGDATAKALAALRAAADAAPNSAQAAAAGPHSRGASPSASAAGAGDGDR